MEEPAQEHADHSLAVTDRHRGVLPGIGPRLHVGSDRVRDFRDRPPSVLLPVVDELGHDIHGRRGRPELLDAPVVEAQPAAEPEPAPAAESTVPAGWYADPSGRYELRYWDGAAWTEHVSRAGQQYTDPPEISRICDDPPTTTRIRAPIPAAFE